MYSPVLNTLHKHSFLSPSFKFYHLKSGAFSNKQLLLSYTWKLISLKIIIPLGLAENACLHLVFICPSSLPAAPVTDTSTKQGDKPCVVHYSGKCPCGRAAGETGPSASIHPGNRSRQEAAGAGAPAGTAGQSHPAGTELTSAKA